MPTLSNYFWTFDSTFGDLSSIYNFTPVNETSLSTATTITGYGSALFLNASLFQYLVMAYPPFTLNQSSWTFELWIYMPSIANDTYYSIITQCQASVLNECLHIVIRQQKPYFGFFYEDVAADEALTPSRWYHLAFTFDCPARNQSIYVNGRLDGTGQVTQCFRGSPGDLYIGYINPQFTSVSTYYNGFIDQLSYTNRSKSSGEVLDAASLTVYLPFDNQSFNDLGPLRVHVCQKGSVNITTGRVGDALEINNVSRSFVQSGALILLGTSNQAYSFSLWVRPLVLQDATIIHVSSARNGLGWCLPMLTLSYSGALKANSWNGGLVSATGSMTPLNLWTHVAITYRANGPLQLYVNGTLCHSTPPFSYLTWSGPFYVTLGNSLFGSNVCGGSPPSDSQYFGLIDEFRLYSRELDAVEILQLANP